jgi:integrase
MRGSTRKRGSTWTAIWDAPPDPITGERRQRTKGGFPTQKAARAFLNEVLVSVADGSYSEPSKRPLARFLLDEWLPARRGQLRPLTASAYESAIRNHVASRDIGAMPLRALTGGHLNRLYAEMEEAGLSTSTRRLVHAVLQRAFKDAVKWGQLPRNPASDADPPASDQARAQAWTAGEMRRFLAHVDNDRLFALWRLAATTGMRRGELLAVTWRALDLHGARLEIDQQLIPTRDGAAFGPPKSARSRRTVALDPDTVAALRRHRDGQLVEQALAGDAYQDHDLVFANELGRPLLPKTLSKQFQRVRERAGLPAGSLHTLRHTAATLGLTSGVPVHIVAARLGDRPETILSVYAHLLPRSDQLAAERVAAAIA